MPVTFRFFFENNLWTLRDEYDGTLSLNQLIPVFNGYNFSTDEFNNIKFLNGGKQMIFDKEYHQTPNGINIFIVTDNDYLRIKLLQLFRLRGQNETIGKPKSENRHNEELPETTVENPIIKLMESNSPASGTRGQVSLGSDPASGMRGPIIQEINKKTIELFKNEDFKHLIRIYKTNPDLFATFEQYIQHGNILRCDDLSDKSKEVISEDTFTSELEYINSLNLDIPKDKIIHVLNLYNGHMNLTLRHLLTNNDN